jgi:PAS domain S-box-containing protein
MISSRARIEDLARFPSENPYPVMRISAAGTVLYANDAAHCFLAHQGGHIGAEAPQFLRDMVNKALGTGSSAQLDTQAQDKIFSITVTPVIDKEYVNIYAQDITDRKTMEEKVLRAKREWERTFDSVPDLIAIMDPEHRIVRTNREMARRIGLTPAQCVGRLCYEAVHGTSCPPEFCPHGRTLTDGQEHAAEIHEQRLGGDFLVTTTPMRDEQGNIVGTVHVARDITELKRIETELRRSRDELDARVRDRTADLAKAVARLELINQELQEFAFVASHDLQEPLRKIQSFCDLVVRTNRDNVDEKGRDYLFRMQKAARRMQQLLRDLLSYSRVATQLAPFTETNLSAVVSEAAEVFELQMREAGVKIEIADLPVIEADSSQMARLFQNLISNALKYKGRNSTVIKIYSEKDESTCRIFVEDNGIGFDEKYLDRIFAPFQRLHGRSEYPGTGMGLAICRKIVERHNGLITARSAPGRGSTFIITLPIKQKT